LALKVVGIEPIEQVIDPHHLRVSWQPALGSAAGFCEVHLGKPKPAS
jgi:hypothetical protein